MNKFVFNYTYCSFPECWECNIPFEYESKEKFILDVLDNPMILDTLGIVTLYSFQMDDKSIWQEEYIKHIDEYVFTLDEWFNKNKVN